MFFTGVQTREQLDALSAAVKIPLILGGVGDALSDLDYLSERRVRICLQGHQPIMAAIRPVHETLRALREGTPPKELANLPSPHLIKLVTPDNAYRPWTKE